MRYLVVLTLAVVICAVTYSAPGAEDDMDGTGVSGDNGVDEYFLQRNELVDQFIAGRGITDPVVIEAMRAVPRHEFVLPEYKDSAYHDRPLPIDAGQTISQPFVVAFMTEALQLSSSSRVLEVGTGSGYQAAVLAEIAGSVYSIEIIDQLSHSSRERLERLGYGEVTVISGDGYFGLESEAPFDGIIVTAAAGHVPSPLVEQLAPGGRMIIPVGPVYDVQVLILLEKHPDGTVTTEQLLPVRFVPMTGRAQAK